MRGDLKISKLVNCKWVLVAFGFTLGLGLGLLLYFKFSINTQQSEQVRTFPVDQELLSQLSSLTSGDLIENQLLNKVYFVRQVSVSEIGVELSTFNNNGPFHFYAEYLAEQPEFTKIIRKIDPRWPEYKKRFDTQKPSRKIE